MRLTVIVLHLFLLSHSHWRDHIQTHRSQTQQTAQVLSSHHYWPNSGSKNPQNRKHRMVSAGPLEQGRSYFHDKIHILWAAFLTAPSCECHLSTLCCPLGIHFFSCIEIILISHDQTQCCLLHQAVILRQ
jgi:hypothetical protein